MEVCLCAATSDHSWLQSYAVGAFVSVLLLTSVGRNLEITYTSLLFQDGPGSQGLFDLGFEHLQGFCILSGRVAF